MARQLKLSYVIEGIEGSGAQALDGITRKLDAFGRSYAGIAAMVGGGIEIKASIDEDSYFRQLAALTNTGLPQMRAYKDHIHEVATESKIAVDEMTHAMASFRTAGGSFDIFNKSADTAADSIAVLGGHGEEVGRVLATLDRSFDIKGPDKLRQNMALVIDELGSVNADFDAFARSFPDISERYAALGLTGTGAVRDLVAVIGTLQTTARSPRQAFGAVNSVLDIMQTEHGRLGFQARTGIAMQDGEGRALPLPQIIANIARAYQPGDAHRSQRYLLETALDVQSLNAIQKFITPEGQKTLKEMLAKGSSSADLDKLQESLGLKAATATSGIGGSLQQVQDKIHTAVDGIVEEFDHFAPALDKASGAIAGVTLALGGAGMVGGAIAGIMTLAGALDLLGLGAGKAAASVEKDAAADATRRKGGRGGTTAVLGKGMIYGWLADQGLTMLDPDDAFGDWADRNIPGGSWLDNLASHVGLGRSYAEQNRVSQALHTDGIGGSRAVNPMPPRGMRIPGAGIGPGAGAVDRTRDMARWLMDEGHLTVDQAAGAAAGAYAESKLDPEAVNPSSGAYGIGQWIGSRKRDLFRRYGPHPSLAQQREFMNWELHGGDAGGASVLSARSEGGALDAYIRRFMRPAPGVETLGDLDRGRAMLSRLSGEITIKVEAADGTKARVTGVKSSDPNLALTYGMGIGMAAP